MRIHPRYIVGAEEVTAVRLWRAARGALGVQGYLPFAGGFADQPACVIASFDLCSEAAASIKGLFGGDGK